MRLLIDADPMVYGCGFSVEKKHPDGSKSVEPVSHAYQAVTMLVGHMRRDINAKLAQHGGRITSESFYLTGKGNYRDKLATIKPYKGNRDPTHKPTHYKALREHLMVKYAARLVEGYEADDAVSMAQYAADWETTIICTIDKDLMMVPGIHYNYKRKSLSIVSPLEGQRAFYTQLLTGDPTDNIGGCYKVGKKRAAELISTIKTESASEFAKQAYLICLEEYRASILHKNCPYKTYHPKSALLENARLLWMQQHPGQLWVPQGMKPAWLPGYGP